MLLMKKGITTYFNSQVNQTDSFLWKQPAQDIGENWRPLQKWVEKGDWVRVHPFATAIFVLIDLLALH